MFNPQRLPSYFQHRSGHPLTEAHLTSAGVSSSPDAQMTGRSRHGQERDAGAAANRVPPAQAHLVPLPEPKPAAPPAEAALPSGATGQASASLGATPDRVTMGQTTAGAKNADLSPAQALADNPGPAYPGLARALGQQGKVILELEVLPNGRPKKVEVFASSGYAALDDAALAAVRRWRFAPGTRGDTPVASTVRVPVRFTLSD